MTFKVNEVGILEYFILPVFHSNSHSQCDQVQTQCKETGKYESCPCVAEIVMEKSNK